MQALSCFHLWHEDPASVLALLTGLLAAELLLAIGVVVHLHGVLLSLAPAYSKKEAQNSRDRTLVVDAAMGGAIHLHVGLLSLAPAQSVEGSSWQHH